MDLGFAVLFIGIAALISAFLLLILGVAYSEFTNSEIPPGVAHPGRLRLIHGLLIGIAIVGKIMEKMGTWSQVGFGRYMRDHVFARKGGEDTQLIIKDLQFEGVPVRAYQPKTPNAGKRRGVMFFHGGGWMFGSINSYDSFCRYVAKETESVVVSVEYHLSPEHRYPIQFEDCLNSTLHFVNSSENYGVDDARIIISGDSAGGNLAAAVCQRLVSRTDLNPVCAQILIYPGLQAVDFKLPSYVQNHSVPILYRLRAIFYFLHYINGEVTLMEDVLAGHHVPVEMKIKYRKWLGPDNIPEEFKTRGFTPSVATAHDEEVYELVQEAFEPTVSPLLAEDATIRKLPHAYILTCEYDVLRDDGLLYKKRLEDNDVPVTWYHIKDGFHGILSYFDWGFLSFPSAKTAIDDIVSFIKTI
ncbi:arylacetamide deacetylase-like 4 [Latimeria chalumnae]|nr:PREDICTED: arylacetamide deacetylase-like 4 [Latimeria chalumnae]|eukprot:XP_006005247.1 PREDICTED: arylacetamide deacetylase-like 4 [Latimeria chalumnae]